MGLALGPADLRLQSSVLQNFDRVFIINEFFGSIKGDESRPVTEPPDPTTIT
jgi:hypothetical protein